MTSFLSEEAHTLRQMALAFVSVVGLSSCDVAALSEVSPTDSLTSAVGVEQSLDLLGPSTCTLRNGRLRDCAIAKKTLTPPAFESAVPLRTELVRTLEGNCTTNFPLSIGIGANGGSPTSFAYLTNSRALIRATDRSPIVSLSVEDTSSWTRSLALDPSCRVSIGFSFNKPDVDTREDALAILDAITRQLTEKQRIRDNYGRLITIASAYDFLRAVSDAYHRGLTTDTMQELRESAVVARPALERMIVGCNDGLSQAEQDALFTLTVSLVAVGHPDDWRNKTLSDIIGPTASTVLATVESMRAELGGAFPGTLQADYEAAARTVAEIEARLALARAQLAPWITE